MPREISVGAVVFLKENKKIKYLLLYRAAHNSYRQAWTIPRGNQEKGESEEETVRREIKEETGITDLEFIAGFREEVSWFYRQKTNQGKALTIFKTAIFYLARTKTKEIKLSNEHQDYAWLSFEDAYKKLTFSSAKRVLKLANDYLKKKKIL